MKPRPKPWWEMDADEFTEFVKESQTAHAAFDKITIEELADFIGKEVEKIFETESRIKEPPSYLTFPTPKNMPQWMRKKLFLEYMGIVVR